MQQFRSVTVLFISFIAALCWISAGSASTSQESAREVISLNGEWQITQGSRNTVPETFNHTAPVPGLVDLARPAFNEVGKKSDLREAFWYRKTFAIGGPLPEVTTLKISKAKFGSVIFLNGKKVTTHLSSFTPAYIDVHDYLKGNGQKNELIIQVGAHRDAVPSAIPTGHDFEKHRYIPGIYDSVELILTNYPAIVRVQTVPDVPGRSVKAVVKIRNENQERFQLQYRLREFSSGLVAASGTVESGQVSGNGVQTVEFQTPIKNCQLWSPDNPFLYVLELSTGSDTYTTRFGVRSFRFDPETGRALLNGEPYYMRGTNVTIYRFFEDEARKSRPWDKEWVRQLHRQFKSMHWNSIRYCIGFPPEQWYEIADEEGFLIQDEFPLWHGGNPDNWPAARTSKVLVEEYTRWMQERWNHPCVVIWDAQNETVTEETGKAIQKVRHLDLSNRPWDNGWAAPQHAGDSRETHPYLFPRYRNNEIPEDGPLADLLDTVRIPHNGPNQRSQVDSTFKNAIIINEYGWLWLHRNGTPTVCKTRTADIYNRLVGPEATVEERRDIYAYYLAALTEYWRAHRKCAGVLHFCGLAYSRPRGPTPEECGATSDHFLDLETLEFEPHFNNYVKDAFAPVGVMIDLWKEKFAPGENLEIQVFVINDLSVKVHKTLQFMLVRDDKILEVFMQDITVEGLGQEIIPFDIALPETSGNYQLRAEIVGDLEAPVQSFRRFEIARD